jgi:hypothetical protein
MFENLICDYLKSGCMVRFRASGSSMHPTIRQDEIVIVAPVQPICPVIGDILLSCCSGKLSAHRLVQIDEYEMPEVRSEPAPIGPRVILRGDACKVCDPPHPSIPLFSVPL